MGLIQWEEKYMLGITEIDMQHKKLVKMLNDMHDAMKEGKSKEILSKILDDMVAYTKTHFTTEERYFDRFNYEKASEHKGEHSQFVEKVLDFKSEYDEGKTMISIQILTFLKTWLTKHIMGSDKKYAPLFKEKGLK